MVMEEGREYVAVPVSFRASRGPFVLRIYAAAPVEVLQEPASPKLAWRAMHRLLMSPAPKTQTPFQRMAYDFGVGEVVVVEAASMALGLAVNQNPSASLSLRFVAAGNHTVLRTQGGMQDGCSDEERNQWQKQAESKAKSRGKGHGQKPNWRLYDVEASIPKFCQSLAFVAVAQLDTWEFSLENMEAKQDLDETPVVSAASAFAPVTPSHWVIKSTEAPCWMIWMMMRNSRLPSWQVRMTQKISDMSKRRKRSQMRTWHWQSAYPSNPFQHHTQM